MRAWWLVVLALTAAACAHEGPRRPIANPHADARSSAGAASSQAAAFGAPGSAFGVMESQPQDVAHGGVPGVAPPATQPLEFPDRAAIESLDRSGGTDWSWDQAHRRATLVLGSDDLFEPGTAKLTQMAVIRLGQLAPALALQLDRMILVRSYTDALGDSAENLALSQRRAEAVCEHLVGRGVPGDRLRAEGRGASRPVTESRTPWGRAQNRRLEIVIEPRRAP